MRNLLNYLLTNRYGVPRQKRLQNLFYEQFFYGHREVLLRYAQLPMDKVFKAVISHGDNYPVYKNHIWKEIGLHGEELIQLKWRSDAEENANNLGINNVYSIGAIGIYELLNQGYNLIDLEENVRSFSANFNWPKFSAQQLDILNECDKILYIPDHSWEGDVIYHRIHELSPLLKVNPKNVTVCLGYLDFVDPRKRSYYLNIGFEVTCAGVRITEIPMSPAGGRTEFLSNFFTILKSHSFVVTDRISTALFYSALLNISCGILELSTEGELEFSSWRNQSEYAKFNNLIRQKYTWLWGENVNKREIYVEIQNLLGLSSVKPGKFFREKIENFSLNEWKY